MTAYKGGVPQHVVTKVLAAFLESVALSLACGEPVMIRGFGKLSPTTRSARTARNPRTGEEHDVPERTTVTFVPSINLRERLNGGR